MKDEMPKWLRYHQKGMKPNVADFFASRVVYYPGAGIDGQPVRTFNSTHSAHCYFHSAC